MVTHSGPFHADDVLAWALVRTFFTADAKITRTRDAAMIAAADLVFDVGGSFDPLTKRFDHHQGTYQGPLSSAGMVLDWLAAAAHVDDRTANALREQLVTYVDAVDNGRRPPQPDVPCFARIVDAYNRGCHSLPEFDAQFSNAAVFAEAYVRGIAAAVDEERHAESVVSAAMDRCAYDGTRVLQFDEHVRWKPIYFALGGADHPSDYVLYPAPDGSWQVLGIPPVLDSFAQKRPLPEEWAGLVDGALEAVIGVPGAKFCHKNLFIAVFHTREAAVESLSRWDRFPR